MKKQAIYIKTLRLRHFVPLEKLKLDLRHVNQMSKSVLSHLLKILDIHQ